MGNPIMIGKRVKQLAKQKNLTVSDMAKITDCSEKNVRRFLNGTIILSYGQFKKLSDALNVTIKELLTEDQEIMDAKRYWTQYHESDFGWDEYGIECPNCKKRYDNDDIKFKMNFCPNCGHPATEEAIKILEKKNETETN